MNRGTILRVGLGLCVLLLGHAALSGACKPRDCSDARANEKRCVGNRVETCNPGGELSYHNCTDDALYCSDVHKGCVAKSVWEAQTASVAASTTGSGMGGSGGVAAASTAMSTMTVAASTSMATTGPGGMGGAGGMGTGGMMEPVVNGCTSGMALDAQGNPAPTVGFGNDFKYTPKCMKVKVGAKVKFQTVDASFSTHPLEGGIIENNQNKPDINSPIQKTIAGTSADFTFPAAGTFPYYCVFHFGLGMYGALYVVP